MTSLQVSSQYSRDAVAHLGKLIRIARQERHMTAQELAERAGISRGLVQRIEKGDLKCNIGAVFEVAAIVGICLFEMDEKGLKQHSHHAAEKLALLPKSVRKTKKVLDDDF